MADTQDGKDIIVLLWKEALGVPAGTEPPGAVGTLIRGEMIPVILQHEYPNG